jgi:hypothetical protein
MKIKKDHFEHLQTSINQVLAQYNDHGQLVNEYERGLFPRSEKTKDLQRRFCFDLLFGAGLNKFVCDELYLYLNDDNIYTALKAIVPKVSRNY